MFARWQVWLSIAASFVLASSLIRSQLATHTALAWQIAGIAGFISAQVVIIGFFIQDRFKLDKLQARNEEAAAALKESETRNTAILAALPDLMFLLDEDGNYLDWYARDLNDLYVPPEQFLGKNMREIMPPDLVELFTDAFRRASVSGAPITLEYSLPIRSKKVAFETRIVKCADGKMLSIVRNVTERKLAELELQQLPSQLLCLQDEERRRIARELHDGTAQNLFAIAVNLQNLRRKISGLTTSGHEMFDECLAQCEQSLQEVRKLSYLLHPPGLDHLGLIPAVRWYVDGFAKRNGIDIRLTAENDIGRLPLDMETDVFRIVQEALSNVFCHSGSSAATILIEKRANHVVLEIKDGGHGMSDWNGDVEKASLLGVGLTSIRERLRRFGGHLDIRSADDGVLLVAQVPVPKGGPAS